MNSLAKQAITVLAGRAVIRLAQFITFVLLARLLTAAEFGWFGIFTTALTLSATLGSLGLRQSFTYQIGQQRMTPGEALGTSILVWPVLTVATTGILFAIYRESSSGIGANEILWIFAVSISSGILVTLLQGIFLGRGDIGKFSLSESSPRVILMIAVLVIAICGGITLSTAMWSYAVGFVATLPIIVFLAIRGSGKMGLRIRNLPNMVRYGLIFAVNLFLITLCTRVSMFVIGNEHGAAAAGEYYAAARVNEIFLEMATALGMVVFSDAARQKRSVSTLQRNARLSCWLFWLFLGLSLIVWVAAPLLLTLVVGNDYASATSTLQILSLGLAPAAASKVVYNTLAGNGSPFFGTPVIVVSLGLNTALAFALVPTFGGVGGAIAVVTGQYLLFAGYLFACKIRFKISVRNFLFPHRSDIVSIWRSSRSRFRVKTLI